MIYKFSGVIYFRYWQIRMIFHYSKNYKVSISLSIVKFNVDEIYSAKGLIASSRILLKLLEQSFLNIVFYFKTLLGFNDYFLKFFVALKCSGMDEIVFKIPVINLDFSLVTLFAVLLNNGLIRWHFI